MNKYGFCGETKLRAATTKESFLGGTKYASAFKTSIQRRVICGKDFSSLLIPSSAKYQLEEDITEVQQDEASGHTESKHVISFEVKPHLEKVARAMHFKMESKDFLLKRQAKAYAKKSSIHGLIYIAEEGRPIFEKLFWFLMTISGAMFCGWLIAPIYTKWYRNPTYTSIKTTNHPVWKMPFPGVTICSNLVIHPERFEDEIRNNLGWDTVETEMKKDVPEFNVRTSLKQALGLMVAEASGHPDDFDINMTNETIFFFNKYKSNITSMMRKASNNCGYMLLSCTWQSTMVDCKDFFETSKSDVGFCCSFNTVKLAQQLDQDFIGKDDGTEVPSSSTQSQKDKGITSAALMQNDRRQKKIVRSNSASSSLGLSVLLDIDIPFYNEDPNFVSNDFLGYKILVHSPNDFPEVGGKGFSVPAGTVAHIGVGARQTSSTDAVKEMSIRRRSCIRYDENKADMKAAGVIMDIFKNYSRQACIIECRAREIYKLCNCLPFYYPNFPNYHDTSCDYAGLQCILENPGILRALATGEDNEFFTKGVDCYCPLECEESEYLPELSLAPLWENGPAVKKKKLYDNDFKSARASNEHFAKLYADQTSAMAVLLGELACVQGNVSQCQMGLIPTDYNVTEIESEIEALEAKLCNTLCEIHRIKKWLYGMTKDAPNDASLIHIYFKHLGVVKYIRDELYSVVDFTAAVGGLFGFCSGFSLLSLVEIFYWFTFRMWNDYTRSKR